ncbi:MAG TPA: hypothetical protein VFL99_08260 [Segeticoccus sp.]|uniref:hypothetical protein n=1 Tax=Segeticoccus sp. TaxID=2706531 RepID=UPI002D7F4A3D|nr:hypothetical protein [Segeticoccus sp.]HET8600304.1 hypothetical protein [Segeticoccus sp.]
MTEIPGDDHRDDRTPGVPEPGTGDVGHEAHRPNDLDAQFAEIVAHWNDPTAEPPAADRGSPGTSAGGDGAGDGAGDGVTGVNPPPYIARIPPARREPPAAPAPDSTPDPPLEPPLEPAWRGYEVDDEEEHFVPPPPRPLPAGDLSFWGILVGLLGGPLLLLYLAFFDRSAGSLWVAAGLALTIGGFALLVARQPRRRDEDDDDTGAQV